jgi:hypothetical protein
MKFFHFLFYKSYRLAILLGNEGFYPEINAWGLVTFLMWMNCASILILLKLYFISAEVFKVLLYLSSSVWIASFYYFIRNKRYEKIIVEIEKEINSKSLTVFSILYSIVSVTVYFLLD